MAFRAAGEARLDGSRVALDDAELAVGDVRLATTFSAEREEAGLHVRSKGGVPLASCDAMLASLPKVLVAELGGLALEGTFTLSYELDYLVNKPDATRVVLDVKNDCRVKSAPPSLSPRRFRSTWVREVKGFDGQSVMIQSGPGAPDWTPYDQISRFMEIAVLVTEDGGFYRHRGFDFRAIERATQGRYSSRSLRARREHDQHAAREEPVSRSRKNPRAKDSRGAPHALARAGALEAGAHGALPQRRRARSRYLRRRSGCGALLQRTSPKDLTLGQALYLASILPDPTRQHFTPDGTVTERWSEYLRKLMRIAHKVERITEEELEAGLIEQVGFRQGGAPQAPVADAAHGDAAAPEPPDAETLGP